MSKDKVPRPPVDAATVDGQPQELDFHPTAMSRLEGAVSLYHTNLRHTSIIVAQQDDCDEVQVKHVKRAGDFVCRMAPESISLTENYQIWWLFSGLCVAAALALPDASQLILGEPLSFALWLVLTIVFFLLVIVGAACAVIAYLIALGPHQPKKFVQAKTAIAKLCAKRS